MVGSTYLSFTKFFHLIKFLGPHHGLSGPLEKLCAQYKHSQYIIKLSIFSHLFALSFLSFITTLNNCLLVTSNCCGIPVTLLGTLPVSGE